VVATRKWTVEELEADPPEGNWELVEGELVMMSPAAPLSARVAAKLVYLVGLAVYPTGAGRLYGSEAGFRLFPGEDTVRSPDLAFIRAERLPDDQAELRMLRMAPDLAAEVRSPSDSRTELLAKCAMYLQAGVPLVWSIDPETRTVAVFQRDRQGRVLGEGDTLDGGDVLPKLSIPVSDIFA